jgi:hypothetical protein
MGDGEAASKICSASSGKTVDRFASMRLYSRPVLWEKMNI